MFNIAARYCTMYRNPSKDYITENMFGQLTEEKCKLKVIYKNPSSPSPGASKKKKESKNTTIVYTVVFACAGLVLLVITIGVLFLFWRRYKRQILAVRYQNFRFGKDRSDSGK